MENGTLPAECHEINYKHKGCNTQSKTSSDWIYEAWRHFVMQHRVLDGRDTGPQERLLPSFPAAQLHSRNPWVALGQQRFCSKYNFLALLLNHAETLEMPSATTLAKGVSPPLRHRAQQPVTELKRWKKHCPGGT